MIVPTSTNPNPNLNKELYTSASLSKPAAIPIGFGIVLPKITVSIDLFFAVTSLYVSNILKRIFKRPKI